MGPWVPLGAMSAHTNRVEQGTVVPLRDGSRALIRSIRPEDRGPLQAGFAQLSDRSRYLRFHTFMASLSEAQLRYLTEVDQRDHVAFVAVAADDESRGLGVARYVKLDDPGVAEAAVTVIDEFQGLGLGTLLLAALARHAVSNGVRTFRNYVLAENSGMLQLFSDLGATRRDDGGGVFQVDLALPLDIEDLPDTPTGRVLKAAARRQLPALDPSLPPVWTPPAPAPPTADDDAGPTLKWRERGALGDWLDEVLRPRPGG